MTTAINKHSKQQVKLNLNANCWSCVQLVKQAHLIPTELDAGFQNYGGYPGDMPMDGMDGVMYDDYQHSMAYDRQPYPEH